MAQGLPVSDVVSVGLILSPTAAVGRNFGTLLITGSSPVIDTGERIREYSSLGGVASDFGTDTPEYLAATAFFGQSPMPYRVKIGRWAQTPTAGVLRGAILPAAVQAQSLAAFQAITAGSLSVPVGGVAVTLSALNFSASANLNSVAAVIDAALGGTGDCLFDGTRFSIVAASTGPASTVGFATTPSGVNVAALTGLSAAAGAQPPVPGILAETVTAAVQALADSASDWYSLMFATVTPLTDAQALQVAAIIEGTSPVRTFGHTVQASAALDGTSTTDLGAVLALSRYSRTFAQFSSTTPFASASFFGRALAVNFNAARSALTMKFKQEPGVLPETLTRSQATALTAKNINVFVRYENSTAIIQHGTMASGRFWDEVHGLDWLSNAVQTDLFNVFYQAQSKVPQTEEGVHVLLTQFEATLSRAVDNGLIAPGIWNAEGFGQLKRGDPLPKGFYVFAPLVASQPQAEREARRAPVLQAAIKMAGAIHTADALISVNR